MGMDDKESCPIDPIANPNVNRWWKHRRRLCYMAFIWSAIQTIGLSIVAIIDPTAVTALGAVVGWSYGLCMTVVMGYYSNTMVDEYQKGKKSP